MNMFSVAPDRNKNLYMNISQILLLKKKDQSHHFREIRLGASSLLS
jgi:hypothetical protein